MRNMVNGLKAPFDNASGVDARRLVSKGEQ
jgi:hypothetical protein